MTKETKPKELTPEEQIELSILDRELELAKGAIRPKFELVVARKQELDKAVKAYEEAHAEYSEAYKEILALEAKANKIAS